MKCEYCDSYIKIVPENGVCPNCGAPLGVEGGRSGKLRFPDPPVGMYTDSVGDYIEVGDTYIKVYKSIPILKDVCRIIPFDKIYAVGFLAGSNPRPGFLCVREQKDGKDSMPSSFWQAVNDNTAITFNSSNSEKFYPVYVFLKKCADIVNGAE